MKPPYPPSPERGTSKAESFKAATTAAVKAIAHRPDANVVFTPVAANQKPGLSATGTDVRLPMPPQKLTRENVVRLRGAADAIALKLRHHNAAIHARRMPVSREAVDAYNAMEQARVEVLGARQYKGVGQNIADAFEQRLSLEGYQAARTYAQIDLAGALRVLVHERCGAVNLGTTGQHIRDILRAE